MSDAEDWREEIARIIDPDAFETAPGTTSFLWPGAFRDREEAVAKADAIILAATAHLSAEREELLEMLAIFLGEDERFQVAVGGNPIAVDRMLDKARDILRRARKLVGGQ